VHALAKEVDKTQRYDGVLLKLGHGRTVHAFRDPGFRISGQASVAVRIVRAHSKR
jgi:hypothetical protein